MVLNILLIAFLLFTAVGKTAGFTVMKPLTKPVSISRFSRASLPLSMQLTPDVVLGITAGVKLFYISQVMYNPDILTKRVLGSQGSEELMKNPKLLQPFRLLQKMVATMMLGVLSIYAYLYFSAGNTITSAPPSSHSLLLNGL